MDFTSGLGAVGSPTVEGYAADPAFADIGGIEAQSKHVQQAAQYAQAAAAHAETLAGHAQALAQWVQKLYSQQQALQDKVIELEEWKKKTLEEMRRLREEHKALRKKFCPDETSILQKAANSLPSSVKLQEPGIPTTAPPGLAPAVEASSVDSQRVITLERTATGSGFVDSRNDGADEQLEKVKTIEMEVGGIPVQRTVWRIVHLSLKLRGCMGKPLVSPPFESWEMKDCRLMLFPDLSQTQNRDRKAKELYQKKVSDGPLDGTVKLKVPETAPGQSTLTYSFTLGNQPKDGPVWRTHNFAELSVSEAVPFTDDWLRELDKDGTLVVSVDIQRKQDDA